MASFDFEGLIKQDREDKKQQPFGGFLLDYLALVKGNPKVSILAHQRMYELLIASGAETVKTEEYPRLKRIYGNDVLKRYTYFKNDFYGIDKTIMKIMRYFHSAGMRGEESRQVLYFVGPVGAGKSSIMEALKRALEMSAPI